MKILDALKDAKQNIIKTSDQDKHSMKNTDINNQEARKFYMFLTKINITKMLYFLLEQLLFLAVVINTALWGTLGFPTKDQKQNIN